MGEGRRNFKIFITVVAWCGGWPVSGAGADFPQLALSGPGGDGRGGYGAAVRLMWETSHPLSFAVAGYAIAASIMPNLVLIARSRPGRPP